jgi:superfamily I DNA and/or RNA helicase
MTSIPSSGSRTHSKLYLNIPSTNYTSCYRARCSLPWAYGLEEWITQNITIGIITPYRAQVDYLNHLAESSSLLEPLHKLVTINTVDAFQGQERDVIVISFVRSNAKGEVGFLADIRRTNVAMTRAKKKLIMIGDSATLGTHPFYVKLLEYLQRMEFYRNFFEI